MEWINHEIESEYEQQAAGGGNEETDDNENWDESTYDRMYSL